MNTDATQSPDSLGSRTGSAFRPTKKFCCQYYHDGGWWSLMIDAYDFQDAEARAKKLGLQLDGEHVMTIPARIGWVARFVVVVRNFFFR